MSILIHNEVRAARLDKGLTQQELADLVQVSRQTIIAIEGGNYAPSLLLSLKLSQLFNTTVNDLFKLGLTRG